MLLSCFTILNVLTKSSRFNSCIMKAHLPQIYYWNKYLKRYCGTPKPTISAGLESAFIVVFWSDSVSLGISLSAGHPTVMPILTKIKEEKTTKGKKNTSRLPPLAELVACTPHRGGGEHRGRRMERRRESMRVRGEREGGAHAPVARRLRRPGESHFPLPHRPPRMDLSPSPSPTLSRVDAASPLKALVWFWWIDETLSANPLL